jgi:drug/metabolite transporter (DMT)-like permease
LVKEPAPSAAAFRLVAAVSLFSLNPIIFRQLPLDPVTILASVCAIAAAVLTAGVVWRQGMAAFVPRAPARWSTARLVVWFVLNNVLYVTALKQTTIANATMTHYLAPLLVAALAAPFLGEPVRRRAVAAMALACAGTAVLLGGSGLSLGDRHFVGLVAGVGSAVFFALEIVEKKNLAPLERPELIALRYLVLGTVLLGPVADRGALAAMPIADLALLLFAGAVTTAGGNILFNSALRVATAQQGATAGYLEPVGAILWGLLLLGEVPDRFAVAGGGLVVAGIALSILGSPSRPAPGRPAAVSARE